jgi:hypothetical protein
MKILKLMICSLILNLGVAFAQSSSNLEKVTEEMSPWKEMASFEVLPLDPTSHRYSKTYAAGAFLANTAVPHFPYEKYGRTPLTSIPPRIISQSLLATLPGQTCTYFVKTRYDLGAGFSTKLIPVLYTHTTASTPGFINNHFIFELLDTKGRSFRFRVSVGEKVQPNLRSYNGFSLSLRGYNVNKINTSIYSSAENPVPNYRMPFEVFESIQFMKSCNFAYKTPKAL